MFKAETVYPLAPGDYIITSTWESENPVMDDTVHNGSVVANFDTMEFGPVAVNTVLTAFGQSNSRQVEILEV